MNFFFIAFIVCQSSRSRPSLFPWRGAHPPPSSPHLVQLPLRPVRHRSHLRIQPSFPPGFIHHSNLSFLLPSLPPPHPRLPSSWLLLNPSHYTCSLFFIFPVISATSGPPIIRLEAARRSLAILFSPLGLAVSESPDPRLLLLFPSLGRSGE